MRSLATPRGEPRQRSEKPRPTVSEPGTQGRGDSVSLTARPCGGPTVSTYCPRVGPSESGRSPRPTRREFGGEPGARPTRSGPPRDPPSGGPGQSPRAARQSFETLVAELAFGDRSLCDMGPALVEIAGAFDNNGQAVLGSLVDADGLFSIGLPTHTQLSEAERPLRRRRLLPLPLSEVSLRSPTLRGVFDAGSFSDQAGVRAWFGFIVATTNALWCGDAVSDRALARRGPATVAQSTAPERLLGVCTSFVELNLGGAKILDVAKELKARSTYGDTEIGTAHTLTLERVVRALPPAGVAASIPASDLCEGFTREALLDPGRVLLAEEDEEEVTEVWARS